ncbi:hypothetical protein QE152_g12726 [Popillia japonica]|uniref:Uncharacterized protein n=1 Tax=Popillia japonica TaxID=7064 RepID=A0AAW1LP07_POPJA
MFQQYHYAILSGVCAASASIFGKFSGSPYLHDLFLARILFFALMVLSNACVWMLLVKSLQNSSSITAVTISTAANYLVSGLCGYLVFGDDEDMSADHKLPKLE